jgi:hypothetical protein
MNGTRSRRTARLSAAALLVALAALAAPARAQDAQTFWVDGYEIGVTLQPVRAGFVLGETVVLSLGFENRSGTDLELLLSGEQGPGWPDDFEITVTGPAGARLPRPGADEDGRETSYSNSYVRATRGRDFPGAMNILLHLTGWAKVERPGRYAVTLRWGVRAGPLGRRYRLFPGTTKPAVEVSAQTTFEVVEGGPEGLGRLIEGLGGVMLKCQQSAAVEAATRLSAIKDERVVKYMAEAMRTCRNPSVTSQALGALSKFATDEAFKALQLAASNADDDLRTTVAHHLGGNKHPRARALLLSMRTDPYYGVRMMVLNVLEGTDTAESRKLIWEMTGDEHPMVRDEALRFLQERATHPPRR